MSRGLLVSWMRIGKAWVQSVIPALSSGQRMKEQYEELQALHETAVFISSNESMDSRLTAIIDAAILLSRAQGCMLYLRADQEKLRLVASKGVASNLVVPGFELEFGEGIEGAIIRQNLPYLIDNNYRDSPWRVQAFEGLFEAVAAVPLIFGHEFIGVLSVIHTRLNATFTIRDIPLLTRLAQHVANSIHDIQLVQEVRRQNEAMLTLNVAGTELNATLDRTKIRAILVEIAYRLVELYLELPPLVVSLAELSKDRRYLDFTSTYPRNELNDLKRRRGQIDLVNGPLGIVGEAVKYRVVQNISDLTRHPTDDLHHPLAQSLLVMPFETGHGRTIGVIVVEHERKSTFPRELQDSLQGLLGQAAVAIEKALLFTEIVLQSEQAKRLLQISTADALEMVAQGILSALADILPYDRATLQRIEGNQRSLLSSSGFEVGQFDEFLLRPVSEDQLVQEILNSKETLILASPNDHLEWFRSKSTEDIQSWVAMPLVYGNEPIGLITVDYLHRDSFTPEHMKLLDIFVQHATSVLQNAILFQQKAERTVGFTEAKGYLEGILEFFRSYRNLALIGLVYGEDIHSAKNQLGIAAARANRIAQGVLDDPTEIRIEVGKIVDAIERYIEMLTELQASALASPEYKQVNIHQMLDQVIATQTSNADVHFTQDYQAEPPIIHAPPQLRQVFGVIIQNALDAMGEHGMLGVATRNESRGATDFVLVSITDTGKGIPEELLGDLFSWRVRSSTRGRLERTGMGLPWAYALMRVHGGNIEFSTSAERGTAMLVLVPRDYDPAHTAVDEATRAFERATEILTALGHRDGVQSHDKPTVSSVDTLNQHSQGDELKVDARSLDAQNGVVEREDLDDPIIEGSSLQRIYSLASKLQYSIYRETPDEKLGIAGNEIRSLIHTSIEDASIYKQHSSLHIIRKLDELLVALKVNELEESTNLARCLRGDLSALSPITN